ncbi:ribosomal-protein-alanine N-acetyltransferase [archaeon]|nr:ribosomal-protein-alanine N-acetyltransferase [archaeon]
MGSVIIRPVLPEDLSGILEIEACSFRAPWNGETFHALLTDGDTFNLTAWKEKKIVGYCFSQSMEKMVHLLNLAVHPDYRRRGIARFLLDKIFLFAISENKSYVFLEVRKSNSIAQALYASMGFSHVLTWRRYYSESGEDASIMMKRISETRS